MPRESPRSRDEDHIHGVARLSPVSVRARAVIPLENGIVVSHERHRGESMLTIPGGRVGRGESAIAAVRREVREETGLEIDVGPLLYIAEVMASARRQDLNLIFLARPLGDLPASVEVARTDDEDLRILPPILDRIRADRAAGWTEIGVWLGNVWEGDLGR